ncbi:MAG: porin family protein [Bacteroidota bacterium]|nr:porin family protein [Bacteroidota bacterium]MDP4217855.1 porin family protein [Bacteroidota bacterium]MDP4247290.1 porin family protein [Bacteroidota bacterium]MDP4256457.1 porin family protein [Bacteroidota bacterium]MDP4258994.1 porin family protein [Bacteroidota bacterium]
MKRTPILLLLLLPVALFCQQPSMQQPTSSQESGTKTKKSEHHFIGIGILAGYNFANVTGASSISTSSRAGYHIGLFLAPDSKSILGSRTELLYSRHGFNYSGGDTTNGAVNLDYIMLTQMMAFHITKYVDIDLGGYTAYLLHVKSDTTQMPSIPGYPNYSSVLSFYNRFDYGIGGGIEIHPFMGILIGVRYQYSFSNLYKSSSAGNPSFQAPSVNLKNNIVMISVGYRF